jgi:hypothetical protein
MATEKDSSGRIRITSEHLQTERVTERVREMEQAQKVALVRSVGSPTDHKSANGALISILIMSGAGLLGGFIAFVFTKMSMSLLANSSSTANNLAFTFLLALAIGLTVAIIDAAQSRIASKVGIAAAIAIPTAVVLGLILGQLANVIYQNLVSGILDAYSQNQDMNWARSQLHLPRGLAWLIVGVTAGLTVGIASKSLKRIALTTAGGALGGFIGGFLFDFFPSDLEWASQLIGISITGLMIGLSMALLEQAARTQWIEIVEGGMAGKQFILYKSNITIGSSPQSDITLIKDSSIAPIHARISTQNGRANLESLNPGLPCSVNGQVGMRFSLVDSSEIAIGATVIRFRERKSALKASGSIERLS